MCTEVVINDMDTIDSVGAFQYYGFEILEHHLDWDDDEVDWEEAAGLCLCWVFVDEVLTHNKCTYVEEGWGFLVTSPWPPGNQCKRTTNTPPEYTPEEGDLEKWLSSLYSQDWSS